MVRLRGRDFLNGTQRIGPGQGARNCVVDEMYPSNVKVEAVVLGLSSHHGIYRLNNRNVLISNVVVRDCVAGPQNRHIPVLGQYTHARAQALEAVGGGARRGLQQ